MSVGIALFRATRPMAAFLDGWVGASMGEEGNGA